MLDALFKIYQAVLTVRELWRKLETKYMHEDATSKKFLVSHFNSYKMVDNRPVMEQLHQIEKVLNHFKMNKMHMDETIIVSSIIDKLPLSWRDFRRSLKHKKMIYHLMIWPNLSVWKKNFICRMNQRNNQFQIPKFVW
ncbi:hypothetical protein Patl1_09499 [Pistacia atlantica]|uniref:Uncharacterized protein n=1 Tax=Pistacia atlantica TaxID=434234 RepID=A0ACC1AGK6_9ROSI|nr:hypothetical protein Patl1_09499 [Pistacia atlantica]